MRIFVDASAWVARAISNDHWAPDLRRVMAELRGKDVELITTTWTLYEALAITRRRKPEATQILFRDAVNNGRVVAVNPEIERRAVERFLDWDDQGASIVDHANALVAERRHCDAILSFDSDFIPLAATARMRILR